MNIDDLQVLFGIETRDTAEPYLFDSGERIAWFDEAVEEACLRKNLLFDDSTAAVTQIAVTTPTTTYTLHAAISAITRAYLVVGTEYHYLDLVTREELDQKRPAWREDTVDEPKYLIVDEEEVRLVPPPSEDGTLYLEVYRVPLDDEKMVETGDEPVIADMHHRFLVYWAVYRALSRPDADYYDPAGAEAAMESFEKYFGTRPTARKIRRNRQNRPHRNTLWT
jgi:hypothetical protein